jgi:hypothetical protein
MNNKGRIMDHWRTPVGADCQPLEHAIYDIKILKQSSNKKKII